MGSTELKRLLMKEELLKENKANSFLNPLSFFELRIMTFYSDIRKILRGEIPFPRMAIIYPVYGCNLDCIGCEYERFNEKPVFLNKERLLSLLEELREVGVEGVEFCGGGEPSLYPHIKDVLEFGEKIGLKFGMITNGTFSPKLAPIFAKYLSYMRITINSSNPKMFLKFQRPKSKKEEYWERILENVKVIRKIRDNLTLGMKVVLGKTNKDEIEEMIEFAWKTGFDNIQFKPLRQSWDSLSEEEIEEIEKKLEKLKSEYRGRVEVIYNLGKEKITRRCILTPLQTTIDAHGNVFLCCYFSMRVEEHKIGNIYQKSFKEIWLGEEHRKKREIINPKICNLFDCRFIKYDKVVQKLIEEDIGQFEFI